MAEEPRAQKRRKPGTPNGTPVTSPQGKSDSNGSSLLPRLTAFGTLLGLGNKVNSIEEAKDFLKAHRILDDNQVVDSNFICAALITLAGLKHRTVDILADGMRSLHYVMKEMNESPPEAKNGYDNEPIMAELEAQKSTLARLEQAIVKMASDNQDELRDLKKGLEETKSGAQRPFVTPHSASAKPSYAAAVARNMEQHHATAIAKGNDRERQVILTIKDESTRREAARLSAKELVAKGDLALELMAKDGVAVPQGAAFVYASTTRKGAVIYQINSKSAAEWLKLDENLESFAGRMGSIDAVHARLFYVLVKFVPVDFVPHNIISRNMVETNNSLPTDAIKHARYIKAPERRRLNQRTAHVIMGFSSRELANQVIENGLLIENKRVYAEKLLTEPTRCFNCQSVKGDHRAAECPHTAPTCARCAGVHKTVECTHMGTTRCVNCQIDGHSAADRDCPAFEQSLASYRRFTPDAEYRFYPIENNTHTWEPRSFDSYTQDTNPLQPRKSSQSSSEDTPRWAPPRIDDNHAMDTEHKEDVLRTPRPTRTLRTLQTTIPWYEEVEKTFSSPLPTSEMKPTGETLPIPS